MLISISMTPKYVDPDQCEWHTYTSSSKLKIESRGSDTYLTKGDVIGIYKVPRGNNKFLLVYPMTLDKPIDVNESFVKKAVKKCKPIKTTPKAAKDYEASLRNGTADKVKTKNQPLSGSNKDSKFFRPKGVRAKQEAEHGIDFTNYQWRKLTIPKYDIYKKDGSKVLTTLHKGDLIGMRYRNGTAGGKVINIRGYQWGVSADDYGSIVDGTDLLPLNMWPKSKISREQIDANKAEDEQELDRQRAIIKSDNAAKRKAEQDAKREQAEKIAADEKARKKAAAEQAAKDEAEFLEEARRKEILRKEQAKKDAETDEDKIFDYLKEDKEELDDIDDDDFDLSSLDEIDLDEDDDDIDESSSDMLGITDETGLADPDERPINTTAVTDGVLSKLDEQLGELKQKAKAFDINALDEEDLDDVDDLDDEDEDLDDDSDLDEEDSGDEDLDEEDGSEDDDLEDLDEEDSGDDETDEDADEDLEDLDEEDSDDPDAGLEDDEEDMSDEEDEELSIDEIRETLIDEGIIDEDEKLSDDEVRELFEQTMNDGDEEDGEEDEDEDLDDEDEDADESADLDDLDGPTDDDLDDIDEGDLDDVDDLDDEDADEDLEDLDEDTGDEPSEDDDTEAPYKAQEGDVVTFKSDKANKHEYAVLDIYPLPKNNNILVYKVYNMTKSPKMVTTVRVSVDKKSPFEKLTKLVRKLNGKEFMDLYLKSEDYPKSEDPIAS